MEVFDAVRTILAVRSYKDQPIPADVVRQIVEAGQLSASAMNKQPWHFVVVESRDTIAQLSALSPTGPYIAQAALAIVVAIEPTNMALSDASRAIQSMMLTAWASGVSSNWVGVRDPGAVRTLLGIPDTLDPLAILPFGYPASAVGKGKKNRKPLGEVASRERFGQPFGDA
jgi:nitroreductase